MTVDGNTVTAMPANREMEWTAAFGADTLDAAGSSWCFRCDDPTDICFGLALADAAPLWRRSLPTDARQCVGSDVRWSEVIAIRGCNPPAFYCGVCEHGKDWLRLLEVWRPGPVRLRFSVSDDLLFVHLNDGVAFEIARKLGRVGRWAPYVSFSTMAIARGASVQID